MVLRVVSVLVRASWYQRGGWPCACTRHPVSKHPSSLIHQDVFFGTLTSASVAKIGRTPWLLDGPGDPQLRI